MDIIKIVLDKLSSEGINATYEKYRIVWHDEFNHELYIYENNIDYSNGKLAWLQSRNEEDFLLRVFESGESFDWVPVTYNYSGPCDCHLLEFYDDYLIFIYHEKHNVYICIIEDRSVGYFNFHGEEIKRKNDMFFFREYGSLNDPIRRIKVPDLLELEPITRKEAEKDYCVPSTIGYLNFLKSSS